MREVCLQVWKKIRAILLFSDFSPKILFLNLESWLQHLERNWENIVRKTFVHLFWGKYIFFSKSFRFSSLTFQTKQNLFFRKSQNFEFSLPLQDAVGVFVKHVVPGSAADHSGNIRVHDRLIAVRPHPPDLFCLYLSVSVSDPSLSFFSQLDGISLHGLTNQEVLEVMRRTGQTVVLSVVRKKPQVLERSLDKGRQKFLDTHIASIVHSTHSPHTTALLFIPTHALIRSHINMI